MNVHLHNPFDFVCRIVAIELSGVNPFASPRKMENGIDKRNYIALEEDPMETAAKNTDVPSA